MESKALYGMIEYFGEDARRINHALKVYGFAGAIMKAEKLSAQEALIIELAAIFHDIGIHEAERKHNSTTGKFQELEGPPIARALLSGMGYGVEIIDRVCFLVGNHHSYGKINGIDFQILVEADFLVNIFEDEMGNEEVASIRNKYFRTAGGIGIINGIYPE